MADAGFARAELVPVLTELGMNHVIRANTGACFSSDRFDGKLFEHGVKEGGHRDLGWGRYTKTRPVQRRVIVRWERGYEDPLVLGTDLTVELAEGRGGVQAEDDDRGAVQGREEHSIRMGPEADEGIDGRAAGADASCAGVRVSPPPRDRARLPRNYVRGALGGKTREQACGFTIGRYMLTRTKWRLRVLLEALSRMLTGWVEENWG